MKKILLIVVAAVVIVLNQSGNASAADKSECEELRIRYVDTTLAMVKTVKILLEFEDAEMELWDELESLDDMEIEEDAKSLYAEILERRLGVVDRVIEDTRLELKGKKEKERIYKNLLLKCSGEYDI